MTSAAATLWCGRQSSRRRGRRRGDGDASLCGAQDVVHDCLRDALTARMSRIAVGDGRHAGTQMGPCINQARVEHAASHVADAVARGARVACGGSAPPGLERGFFFSPTLLEGVTVGMDVFREETFAPVIPMLKCAAPPPPSLCAAVAWHRPPVRELHDKLHHDGNPELHMSSAAQRAHTLNSSCITTTDARPSPCRSSISMYVSVNVLLCQPCHLTSFVSSVQCCSTPAAAVAGMHGQWHRTRPACGIEMSLPVCRAAAPLLVPQYRILTSSPASSRFGRFGWIATPAAAVAGMDSGSFASARDGACGSRARL